jgi:biotin carboxylase
MSGHVVFIESNFTGTGMQALRLAHEAGHHVTFVSADPEAYRRRPEGVAVDRYVHEVVTCPTNDPDVVEKAVRDLVRPATAVMTVAEYFVPVAAQVARRLGLVGVDPATAALCRDKRVARRECEAAGIPVPRYAFVRGREQARAAVEHTGLPCVVKPADESASVDVRMCATLSEVEEHVALLSDRRANSRGQEHEPGALLEEFLFGPEVSVETFSQHGRHTVLGVTDKVLGPVPTFVELGHTFPSVLPAAVTARCDEAARRVLDATGYAFGAAHLEFRLTATGPVLIEINARTGGDHIPALVEHALGIPLLDRAVGLFTGTPAELAPTRSAGAAIRFLVGAPGRVAAIDGRDNALRIPGVIDVQLVVKPGDVIRRARNSHDRLGFVLATAASSAEAAAAAEAGLAQLAITYAEDQPAGTA